MMEPWITRRRYELPEQKWSILSPLLPNQVPGVPRVDEDPVSKLMSPWPKQPKKDRRRT
jgi:transposase